MNVRMIVKIRSNHFTALKYLGWATSRLFPDQVNNLIDGLLGILQQNQPLPPPPPPPSEPPINKDPE